MFEDKSLIFMSNGLVFKIIAQGLVVVKDWT